MLLEEGELREANAAESTTASIFWRGDDLRWFADRIRQAPRGGRPTLAGACPEREGRRSDMTIP